MPLGDIQILSGVEGLQMVNISKIITVEEAGLLESVPMSSIRPLNKSHVNNIAASNSDEWPPIELVHIRDTSKIAINYGVLDEYVLVDGLHRYHAAIKKSMSTIASYVRSYPDTDAIVGAYLLANVKHGLPANRKARLVSALWLYDQHEDMTIEEISSRVSLPVATIRRAIRSLLEVEDTSQVKTLYEIEDLKQARLFVLSLARFMKKQSELYRFQDMSDYEGDVSDTALDIQMFLQGVTPSKGKEYEKYIRTVSDILTELDGLLSFKE